MPNEIDKTGQERDIDLWTKEFFDKVAFSKALAKRKSICEEFETAEQKWSKVNVPDKKDYEKIEKLAIELRNELVHLRDTQQRCWEKPLDYPAIFLDYKEQVKESVRKHRQALSLLEGFSRLDAKSKCIGIQSSIDRCVSVLKRGRKFLDFSQQRRAESVIATLQTKRYGFIQIGKTFDRAEQLKSEIEGYKKELDQFKKDTHNWIPIEESTTTIKSGRVANPDSSMEDRQPITERFVSNWKCSKCNRTLSVSETQYFISRWKSNK